MAKSFVVTNRKRLDEYFRNGGTIEGLVLQVGQLSGKPKYKAGHVGAKSRDRNRNVRRRIKPEELARRSVIRALRRQLADLPKEQRKEAAKDIRRALREKGVSSKGLTRKRQVRTAVAKVAGVLAADDKYHGRAVVQHIPLSRKMLDEINDAMKGRGGSMTNALKRLGKSLRDAVRGNLSKMQHVDTGKLLRNTQFQLVNRAEKERVDAELKAIREQRKAAKRAKKGQG
jgi:hypothetical protein